MNQHTPGPWNLVVRHDGDVGLTWYVESDVAPGVLAEGQNNRSDARLIAAAPDLLEAAKDMLGQLMGVGIAANADDADDADTGQWAGAEGMCFSKLRAAIAKAEGRDII